MISNRGIVPAFLFTLILFALCAPARAATDSLWSTATVPANLNEPDTSSVELGVKFTSSVSGTVSAIRFYKGAQNTGSHTVSLWTSAGTKLATATATNETPSGWQTVTLSAPMSITAGTTYVASYHTPGHYSDNLNYFTAAYSNSPLSAPIGAGVYRYGTASAFPNSTWNNSNYWVDIVFNPTTVTPINGACGSSNGADLTSAPTTNLCAMGTASAASGSGPWTWSCAGSNGGTTAQCQALLLTNGTCGAANGVAVNSPPSSGLCTTGPASAVSGSGPWTWSCAGSNGGSAASCSAPLLAQTKDSLWSTSVTPANVDANDNSSVELGVKFTSSVTGTVSAIRFYKGPTNVGPHTVSLWSAAGTKLATAAAAGETASGWQTVPLNTPISIAAGTTYVASYHTPGFYAEDDNYFTATYTNGPLSAPVGAGVYNYGSSTVFPSSVWNNANYYVDILLTPASGGGGGAVNGACGSSNGADLTGKPTTNLCAMGTASAVTGAGPWNWSCAVSGGGTTAQCQALLLANGSCGSANGVAVSSAPTTNLCSAGTTSTVTGSGPWAWSCAGSNGGTTASCSAPLTQQAVNGQCGPMNGVTTNVAPTTGLCNAGTASSVSGSGPWTWSCAGSNGGTTASCDAFSITSGTCPKGTAYADGCANAPACTPGSTTCYEQQNFFTSYTPAGDISAHRPPWNVAGVDYPVGVNDSCITAGLKNPATNPPAGTSYSGGTLNVTGNNVTIDCYDMSNTYIYMANASGTVTVTNNKFDNENGMSCPYNPSHALNLVAKYNTFHGATGDINFNDFIHFSCSGNVTSEYNYFRTSSKDFMEFAPQSRGNIALVQFNFGQCLAAAAANHGQPNEDYGIQNGTTQQLYNTFYDDGCQSITNGASGVTALCEFDPESSDINPVCSSNTLVDTFGDSDVIEMCAAGPGGGNCHSSDTSTSQGVNGTVTINSNYILYGKSPYYTAPKSGSGVTSTISSGNLNLLNGHACNAYAGSCP